MSHFDKDFISFFEELAGDNSKQWFDENRDRYHKIIKDPWYAFLQLVIDEIAKKETDFYLEPKHAVFRINRDIRFSKNKQPYKTHVAAVISKRGRKDMTYPGLYIHAGQDGVHFGCGCYKLDKQQLHALRKAIVQYPKKTQKILTNKTLLELFGEIQGDKNKIIPKEFKPYVEDIPLVVNKQFYFYKKYPPKIILKKDLLDIVMHHWHVAQLWNIFIVSALGFEE